MKKLKRNLNKNTSITKFDQGLGSSAYWHIVRQMERFESKCPKLGVQKLNLWMKEYALEY